MMGSTGIIIELPSVMISGMVATLATSQRVFLRIASHLSAARALSAILSLVEQCRHGDNPYHVKVCQRMIDDGVGTRRPGNIGPERRAENEIHRAHDKDACADTAKTAKQGDGAEHDCGGFESQHTKCRRDRAQDGDGEGNK